jgi:hypothetical protein
MKKLATAGLLVVFASVLGAQDAPKPLNAEPLIQDWLKRLNALADWDGKSETKPLVDRFAELYDPQVLLFTGPNENQLGSVTWSGMEGLRYWADWFAHTYSKSEFRTQAQTQKMKTAQALVLQTTPPWGGTALSVEITAFYTLRTNQKKFAQPGVLTFVFTPEGKINRTRFYLLSDERFEVLP